jgi:exonuclease SbcD
MRILHTADWHLGDRLGRIDRTEDIRRAVERVADYCASERVDVLVVAGDLFSELAGPDSLREAIRHLQAVFEEFLRDGGTILTLTGNHDREIFCQTLRHAMSLASPVPSRPDTVCQLGRLYLATEATLLRLGDRTTGHAVQFVLMPYPTPPRYLTDEASQRYRSLAEKNRHLMNAFTHRLRSILKGDGFDRSLPSVLAAHVAVKGCDLATRFRLTSEEDVVLDDTSLLDGFAYVGLGHIHKPQCLGGRPGVRYCGSIERLDLGEGNDDKGVVLVDVGPDGLQADPVFLPLEATRVYTVQITAPRQQLPALRVQYASAQDDLVRIECTYTAGVDNREELLRELDAIFPRWYDRQVTEVNALTGTLVIGETTRNKGFEETVRAYLAQELLNHPDAVRDAVLARAEALMREVVE